MQQVIAGVDQFYNKGKKTGISNLEESKESVNTTASSIDNSGAFDQKREDLRNKMGPDVFDYYY